ncbi:glycosyltransferase family 2 protein [Roseivivax sp. THAF30]|uniref:glycosyltransferase family 2 protein n=1 Tax=Roseivivax sp. THAF30 TaxID=2587852 RepID=UPI0012691E82|nr:glycosyltransferase family 2 protein [Roseivivax sp. THAF30]QFT62742.1 Glycosyl transferase family 2 [Roseivivax sp. THAF30]
MKITVVILTLNEACHIERALRSVALFADRCFVIDSGSTDDTAEIARRMGADVLVHPFVTQAQQFNWALDQLPPETDWIFRLDADEVVSPTLVRSLSQVLPGLGPDVAGASVPRRMAFLGRPIRWGGMFPARITRVLRQGRGRSEDRWMDEHILLDGLEAQLDGELLDDNLKPLGWWTDKHNKYASREVVEILDAQYGFLGRDTQNKLEGQTGLKRWMKEKVYMRLPGGLRALAYFVYRYIVRLGFLDGKEGAAFHLLQGFWYRYLVDIKLYEVESYIKAHDADVVDAIRDVLGITIPVEEK